MSLTSARVIVLTSVFGSAIGLAVLVAVFPALDVDLDDPVGWLTAAPPEDGLAAVGWLTAALLCCYLVISTLAYAGARLTTSQRGVRIVGRMVASPVRRSVDLIAAIAVSMATLGPFGESAAAIAHGPGQAVVRTHHPTDSTIVPPGQGGTGFTLAPDTTHPDDDSTPDRDETAYEVAPGDNLWTIACRHIRDLEDDPNLAQITEYWLRVIEANTGRLRSGDPDLIFPGERISLPAIAGDDGS